MKEKHALSAAAALIADPGRSAILVALLDGRALTAGELARAAEVSAQSASLHLAKLLNGGMVQVYPQGRHRYYRLAGAEVARVIEALGTVATRKPAGVRLRTPRDAALCFARTCYDHLAGTIAVELTATMERNGVLVSSGEREYAPGPQASVWLARIGVDGGGCASNGRRFARRCMDWTERRPHVAGALGAELLRTFLEHGWVKAHGETRVLRVTDAGRAALAEMGIPAH